MSSDNISRRRFCWLYWPQSIRSGRRLYQNWFKIILYSLKHNSTQFITNFTVIIYYFSLSYQSKGSFMDRNLRVTTIKHKVKIHMALYNLFFCFLRNINAFSEGQKQTWNAEKIRKLLAWIIWQFWWRQTLSKKNSLVIHVHVYKIIIHITDKSTDTGGKFWKWNFKFQPLIQQTFDLWKTSSNEIFLFTVLV